MNKKQIKKWASIILLIERRLYRNGAPSGKKGIELGFDEDETYYLILEERISRIILYFIILYLISSFFLFLSCLF